MAFDEHMEPEIQRVLDTAAILEITEFEVFRLSYDRWFGRPANDVLIERFFCNYMFEMIVPSWVNHFTRRVMALYNEGRLDPTRYGIFPKPVSHASTRMGIQIAVIVTTILICLFLLADNVTEFYDLTGIFR
ncbi:MAG: hypothetical protein P8Z39_01050 [Gammaproteobacteria bacterium]|jgi:hypothetical protein